MALTFVRAFLYRKVFHHFAVKLFRATHFMSLRGIARCSIPYEVLNVIARHYKIGDPAGYCVPVGKRRKQAKE